MKRLLLLFLCLVSCAGCASDKGAWGEVLKDLRGDNMQMRGFGDEVDRPSK
jgi:hypothetical protein